MYVHQDHRNASLRDWLINDFTLGNVSGLGNPAIDGFYFDDSWSAAPATPPTGKWHGCNASPIGGASEENPYCAIDMGLTKDDVAQIASNWSLTGDKVLHSHPVLTPCTHTLYSHPVLTHCTHSPGTR
jgi:hypothetical protein